MERVDLSQNFIFATTYLRAFVKSLCKESFLKAFIKVLFICCSGCSNGAVVYAFVIGAVMVTL